MKELLEKMVASLQKQVEEKVPEMGNFDVVYEREEVSDLHLGLSHIILKVTNVGVKGSEDERYLDIAGVNYPSPYGCVSTIGFGHTADINIHGHLHSLHREDMSRHRRIRSRC